MSEAPRQAARPLIKQAIEDLFPEACGFVVAVRSKNGHTVVCAEASPAFVREVIGYLVDTLVKEIDGATP